METVSVVGLGKLGAPLLATLALRGHKVIGVDTKAQTIEAIKNGKPLWYEPMLSEFIDIFKNSVSATTDYDHAITNSNMTFIVVHTPSEKNGQFSNQFVLQACEQIGRVLRSKNDYHLVVLTSTVSPFSCQEQAIPTLEKHSQKKCGSGFGFCYNREFIALGSVIKNLLNPDFVLIGQSDEKSGEMLKKFYQGFCLNSPLISSMNLINAEITKLALNSYVTMKISFANFLSQLCQAVPGGDVDQVTSALGQDIRIGQKYFKGALGYGGPCFPRDNKALAAFSTQLGVKASLPLASDLLNDSQIDNLVDSLNRQLPKKSTVGVFGLSYKPDTSVIEESQAITLAQRFAKKHKVMVFDPIAMPNAQKVLNGHVHYASDPTECLEVCQAIIIATPWPIFSHLDIFGALEKRKSSLTLFDCWRVYSKDTKLLSHPKLKYFGLGLGNALVK